MLPGEVSPRVVRLECLWEEQPTSGAPRMLARCSRMYRPEVCVRVLCVCVCCVCACVVCVRVLCVRVL